jgi:3',5'-cyclic AMP phosphodiesterase CpdA
VPTTPFSFAVVADPHCAERHNTLGPPEDTHGTHLDRVLRCVRAMEDLPEQARPDFVLVVGDIHLWEMQKVFDRIPFPLHVIAGNHESGDRKAEMRALFPDDFQIDGAPADYYSFVHKGARFIGVCDAGRGGEHVGQLCSEDFIPRGQCEWLEQELAHAESTKFVFAHIPPEPHGRDVNMFMSRNDSRYFNDLIAKTQPTALFFGHLHQATREYTIGSSRLFTVRSCSWNFGQAPLGFLMVHVRQDGIRVEEVLTS